MDNKGIDNNGEVTAEAVVENQNNIGPEKGISKGEERYNKMATSIGNAKSRLSGWFSKGAAGLGRLFKSGAVGVLNSPEAVVSGVKATGKVIGQEVGYMKDAAVGGYNFVGENISAGVKSVGDDFTQFDKYTSEKAEQLGVWVGKGVASLYESTTEKYNKTKNFAKEKAGQANDYLKDKALNIEAVGRVIKNGTKETLNNAKEGIARNYNGIIEHGKNSIDWALLRSKNAREKYNSWMNDKKKSILEAKAEIQAEKLQKILAKLEQYKQVEQMGNNLEVVTA